MESFLKVATLLLLLFTYGKADFFSDDSSQNDDPTTEDDLFVNYVKQQYEPNINSEITNQIQRELIASYVYQGYASWFGRADIALPGFQKFFQEASKEEREHAQKLIDYVNQRGGYVKFNQIDLSVACDVMVDSIVVPNGRRACICEFLKTKSDQECELKFKEESGLQAMEDALSLERFVNQQLLNLHDSAEDKDPHFVHILEHEFLEEQVSSIRKLAGYVTRLRSFKTQYTLGEYLFDRQLQEKSC